MVRTVNELLVLVETIIGKIEFSGGGLGRAVTVGQVVEDELHELLLAGESLLDEGITDSSPNPVHLSVLSKLSSVMGLWYNKPQKSWRPRRK